MTTKWFSGQRACGVGVFQVFVLLSCGTNRLRRVRRCCHEARRANLISNGSPPAQAPLGEEAASSRRVRPSDDPSVKRIYRHFVETIKSGRYGPGTKIPAERELVVRFNTSRTMVRHALRVLEEDGLIDRHIGSGTFMRARARALSGSGKAIPSVSPLDVLEARLALEPGLADLVVSRASADDLHRIEVAFGRMTIAESASQVEFKESGYDVHKEIVRATKNSLLIHFYDQLFEARAQAGWDTLRQLNDSPELRSEQVALVAQIVAALKARDARKASEVSKTSKLRMIQQIVGAGSS